MPTLGFMLGCHRTRFAGSKFNRIVCNMLQTVNTHFMRLALLPNISNNFNYVPAITTCYIHITYNDKRNKIVKYRYRMLIDKKVLICCLKGNHSLSNAICFLPGLISGFIIRRRWRCGLAPGDCKHK